MRKKILIGVAALIAVDAFANNLPTREEIEQKDKEYLLKAGIDIPDTPEIRIVPANKYLAKKNLTNNQDDDFMATQVQNYLKMHSEQQKSGFVKIKEPRAKELMELKQIAPIHLKKYKGVLSPTSTHLRPSINELKLAYTFVGVPESDMDKSIGISPYGVYKQIKNGDDGDGWDGAVQFFDKNGVGSCAFTEHNRKLAHSGVELIKELVSYEVDNKPTILLIKGTKETGYIYKLKWYDATFSRELECANSDYSPKLRADVIELANRIEAYQQS